MKILQVINAFYPPYVSGGAAFVAHDISQALAKRGHKVTVFTTNVLNRDRLFTPKQTSYFQNGVNVCYFNNEVYKPSVQIYFSRELMAAIKENICSYDLVHVHEYRSYIGLATRHYATKVGVPYILQVHGQLPRTRPSQGPKLAFDLFFGYRLLKGAARVIALSQTEAQQYSAMGVCREKIEIIPNGIELENYAELPSKGLLKKKLGIRCGSKLVLYLGRIHENKGIDFLIRAYAYMIKAKKYHDVFLVIAGPDDGYLKKLKQLSTNLKINNSTLFTGHLSEEEKLSAYVDSDLVVNVEPRNVFGLVPLEAAACSRPVIVSTGNSISEIVRQGRFGFSVKYGDTSELARNMFKVLDDEDFAKEIGQNGQQYLRENLTWDKIVIKIEKVYNEIA
jgi:glycosyltransferase involved in cell wall biosynthesis